MFLAHRQKPRKIHEWKKRRKRKSNWQLIFFYQTVHCLFYSLSVQLFNGVKIFSVSLQLLGLTYYLLSKWLRDVFTWLWYPSLLGFYLLDNAPEMVELISMFLILLICSCIIWLNCKVLVVLCCNTKCFRASNNSFKVPLLEQQETKENSQEEEQKDSLAIFFILLVLVLAIFVVHLLIITEFHYMPESLAIVLLGMLCSIFTVYILRFRSCYWSDFVIHEMGLDRGRSFQS